MSEEREKGLWPGVTEPLGEALRRGLASEHFVLGLCVVYFVAFLPFAPALASPETLSNIASSVLPLAVLSIGATVVLIAGGIDLSVTSIVALTSVLGAKIATADEGWLAGHPLAVPAAFGAMVLGGAILGAANGLAVALFRMPAFIVTLTSMMFLSGLAVWATGSRPIGNLPEGFLSVGRVLWITLAAVLIVGGGVHLILGRTLFGRWVYAVGHNRRAAWISGVPVGLVTVGAYALSGLCAGAASAIYTARLATGSPVMGREMLLDVVGATILGGTSLFGGKGKVLWTVFGVLFLTVVDTSLNLRNYSDFTVRIVKGTVILLAALLDVARTRWLER